MNKGNKKKNIQLGMPYGTACGQLRKKILFKYIKIANEDTCFHCQQKIQTSDDLSIEHRNPWLDISTDLFWDLNNITFSHLKCNIKNTRQPLKGKGKHPGQWAYKMGCRCQKCRDIEAIRRKNQRVRGIKT